MKPTRGNFFRLFFCSLSLLLLASLGGCGEDAGLYNQEQLTFESGSELSSEQKKELDLGADDANNFGFWPPTFFPFPAPVFPYYTQPVPVAIPISPFQAITEWIHPFYAIDMLPVSFWPNTFAGC